MGRPLRVAAGGVIYHVLNRANARRRIFREARDFEAFERVLREAQSRVPTRVLAYCLMPNHWHLVLWPYLDGDLTRFVGWVTMTHTQRWHAYRESAGTGHVYQGRYKSFPVQQDAHFLMVCRYVERNPLRAGLVSRAEDWRWSSLWHRTHGAPGKTVWLSRWPIERPPSWDEWVNESQPQTELENVRRSARRGQPYGSRDWVDVTAEVLQLDSTLRPRGRPAKSP